MVMDTRPDHTFFQLYSEPSCFGFNGTARFRTWCIGMHNERTRCLYDPFQLHDLITEGFENRKISTQISDYLVASTAEILMEASDLAKTRKRHGFVPGKSDMWDLLTDREKQAALTWDHEYFCKFGRLARNDVNLVYFLGDSPSYGNVWSANSGMIPTFRLNSRSGLFWLPAQSRYMTGKERLTAMSFPCTKELSDAMQAPLLGATDTKRAADVSGNSMHFTSAGILQLIALSCFGPD